MAEYETISRGELAARLGISDADLLTREQAAALIGIKPTYLSNLKNDGPAFYRSTNAPRGGVAWYPRAIVEEYAGHRASKAKSSFAGSVGLLEWPPSSGGAGSSVPVHLVVEMIQKWKRRELYRRAQKVLNDPFSEDEAFKDELRMFGAPWPEGRMEALAVAVGDPDATARRDIFKSLDDQATAVTRKLRSLCDAEGTFPSFRHPSYQVLSSLLEDAWRDVVLTERRWRALDYSGMPAQPPD
jgi:hypothetical protein